MPANNFMSNPVTLPENGPTIRFMVGFEDMDQQGQGITWPLTGRTASKCL